MKPKLHLWLSGNLSCMKKFFPFHVLCGHNAMHLAMTVCSLWASEKCLFIIKQNNLSSDIGKCCYLFLQFLQLASSLRFYGYVQFKPCTTNYPEEDTRVIISVGNRELNFRLQTPGVSVYLNRVTALLKRFTWKYNVLSLLISWTRNISGRFHSLFWLEENLFYHFLCL